MTRPSRDGTTLTVFCSVISNVAATGGISSGASAGAIAACSLSASTVSASALPETRVPIAVASCAGVIRTCACPVRSVTSSRSSARARAAAVVTAAAIDLRVERADRQGDHVAVGARQHVHERRARLFPQDPGAGARLDRDDTRTVEPQAALDCGVAGLRRPAVEHALEPLVVVDHAERDVLGAHEPPGGAGELREEVAAPAGVHRRAGGGPGVDREVEERGVGRRLVAVDPHADGRA